MSINASNCNKIPSQGGPTIADLRKFAQSVGINPTGLIKKDICERLSAYFTSSVQASASSSASASASASSKPSNQSNKTLSPPSASASVKPSHQSEERSAPDPDIFQLNPNFQGLE